MLKIQILGQLLDSREGRASGVELPGLREAVRLQKFARLPLLGSILKHFIELEGNSDFENNLRAVEQQIFLLDQHADAHFDRLEQSMTRLRQLIAQQGQQNMTTAQHGVSVTSAATPIQMTAFPIPEPENLNTLPARARDIFNKFKMAATRHAEGVY